MKIRYKLLIILGKTIRYVSRLFGHGGSALPGLILEKITPNFLNDVLSSLPDGVIMVVGTNGKTTTTKIISELLTSQGKRVLTNRTGSNFSRGIIATIINEYHFRERSLAKDVAVLELDEAYGRLFVKKVKPEYVVALNVMRDQLDRYGELGLTRQMLSEILKAATKGCVVNGDDPQLIIASKDLKVPVHYYGVSSELYHLFPSDSELLKASAGKPNASRPNFNVQLESFKDQDATYLIERKAHKIHLSLKGQHNFHNAAAALAMVRMVLPAVSIESWLDSLKTIKPAFGRGEIIKVGDDTVELMLVKNPGSFRQVLASTDSEALTMIAINDRHADGRDVSWLWDVDFTVYKSEIYVVSGIRASDMALRLQYDNALPKHIEHDMMRAINELLASPTDLPKRIFCTYTAMLEIRTNIRKLTSLPANL